MEDNDRQYHLLSTMPADGLVTGEASASVVIVLTSFPGIFMGQHGDVTSVIRCLISLINLLFIIFMLRCAETNAVKLLITDPQRGPDLLALCERNPPVTSGFSSQRNMWYVTEFFSKLFVWTSCWTNIWTTGDLRHHGAHVTAMGLLRSGRSDVRRPHVGDWQAQLLDAIVVLWIPRQQAVLPSLKTEGTGLNWYSVRDLVIYQNEFYKLFNFSRLWGFVRFHVETPYPLTLQQLGHFFFLFQNAFLFSNIIRNKCNISAWN